MNKYKIYIQPIIISYIIMIILSTCPYQLHLELLLQGQSYCFFQSSVFPLCLVVFEVLKYILQLLLLLRNIQVLMIVMTMLLLSYCWLFLCVVLLPAMFWRDVCCWLLLMKRGVRLSRTVKCTPGHDSRLTCLTFELLLDTRER